MMVPTASHGEDSPKVQNDSYAIFLVTVSTVLKLPWLSCNIVCINSSSCGHMSCSSFFKSIWPAMNSLRETRSKSGTSLTVLPKPRSDIIHKISKVDQNATKCYVIWEWLMPRWNSCRLQAGREYCLCLGRGKLWVPFQAATNHLILVSLACIDNVLLYLHVIMINLPNKGHMHFSLLEIGKLRHFACRLFGCKVQTAGIGNWSKIGYSLGILSFSLQEWTPLLLFENEKWE